MLNFIINVIIWTLALYGAFEIVKTIIYFATTPKTEKKGTYIIITTKNEEEYIEGFLRSVIFKVLYGKEDYIEQILIADLDSKDNTREIIEKMELDNEIIKIVDWEDCKKIIENKI